MYGILHTAQVYTVLRYLPLPTGHLPVSGILMPVAKIRNADVSCVVLIRDKINGTLILIFYAMNIETIYINVYNP